MSSVDIYRTHLHMYGARENKIKGSDGFYVLDDFRFGCRQLANKRRGNGLKYFSIIVTTKKLIDNSHTEIEHSMAYSPRIGCCGCDFVLFYVLVVDTPFLFKSYNVTELTNYSIQRSLLDESI